MQQNYMDENISDFLENCAKQFCPWCGMPVTRNRTGRPKKFCSDKCRWAFWKFETRHKAEKLKMEKMLSDWSGSGKEDGDGH